MTAKCLTELIKDIAVNYRYTYKDCPEEAMQRMLVSWFEVFVPYTDEEVTRAFKICLSRCKQPPTPADIVEKIEKARDLKRPSKSEIWERLIKAVEKTKYTVYVKDVGFRQLYSLKNEECRKHFNDLPECVRKWLGFDAFCALAEMSNTALSMERARFMKEIDEIRETIRENRQVTMAELLPLKDTPKLKQGT